MLIPKLTMMSALLIIVKTYLNISKFNWADGRGDLVKYRVGNPHPSREPVLLQEILDPPLTYILKLFKC